ncbi:hypothetical protein P3T21_000025 [Paraburkholderia sp. GAS334]|jgi:hypothetical protein
MELKTLRDWLYAMLKARAERLFPMQRASPKR